MELKVNMLSKTPRFLSYVESCQDVEGGGVMKVKGDN
jgi:hypothetical protein